MNKNTQNNMIELKKKDKMKNKTTSLIPCQCVKICQYNTVDGVCFYRIVKTEPRQYTTAVNFMNNCYSN